MSDDFANLDAVATAQLISSGEASATEVVDAAIARIARLNPALNAVIMERFDKARAEAAGDLPDGPFRGVPLLLKDLGAQMVGEPNHSGSRALKGIDYRATEDSYLAARLQAAGFVILGRTNTPEFGSTATTEPEAYGPSRNPWNLDHSTGGSSGGSGAAVASRMVPAAHASDGGGSIRIPASECGIFGLKPSRGRISRGPAAGEGWGGASTDGCVSVSVRDSAAILDVMAGWESGDPYIAPPPARPFADEVGQAPGRLRIGVTSTHPLPGFETHPECVAAVEATALLLESLGHEVDRDAHPAALDDMSFLAPYLKVLSSAMHTQKVELEQLLGRPLGPEDMEFANLASAAQGAALSASDYVAAVSTLHRYNRTMTSWWKGYDDSAASDSGDFDLLLCPTLSGPPPKLGVLVTDPDNPDAAMNALISLIPCTPQFNSTGQPAMSVPLAVSTEGLPIGSQLIAQYGREDLLIRVAAQLEEAQPWAGLLPGL